MSQIQSLIESANPWQSQQGEASRLANKWEKSGLLEGLTKSQTLELVVLLLQELVSSGLA